MSVILVAPRRRYSQFAILAALLAGALTALVVGLNGGPRSGQPTAARSERGRSFVATVPPFAVFVQDPYMGVSCHVANSIACDRVGLAVWLERRASVTASIAGEPPFRLNDPTWSYVVRHDGWPVYVYAGFLQPAGLTTRLHVTPVGPSTWMGTDSPAPSVRFRIDYGHGDVVITKERVSVNAGWG